MYVKQILIPIINEELKKHEEEGKAIVLKSQYQVKMMGFWILLAFSFLVCIFMFKNIFFFGVVAIGLYFLVLRTRENAEIIYMLAERNPDVLIEEIINNEVKMVPKSKRRLNAILSGCIAVIFVALGVCFTPFDKDVEEKAIERSVYEESVFEACEGGYKLLYCGEKYKEEEVVVIPEQFAGVDVVEIGGAAFQGFTNMKEVVIPETITIIHGDAFKGCSALEKVELPARITEIRGNTFEYCYSLKAIHIPDGVTRIAAHAFYGCSSLAEAYVPDTVTEIGSSAFRKCDSLMIIEIPKNTEVNERAFKESPTKVIYK